MQYIASTSKGLYPDTPEAAAQAQMIVLGAEDLFQAYWVCADRTTTTITLTLTLHTQLLLRTILTNTQHRVCWCWCCLCFD
jgi:hypothetical protein